MKTSIKINLLSTAIILVAAQTANAQVVLSPNTALNVGVTAANFKGGTDATLKTTTSASRAAYSSFNIGAGESYTINQPSTASIHYGFVNSTKDGSQIFGNLSTNGRLVLKDPSGITFGPNSHVTAAALMATTANTFQTFGEGSGPLGLYGDIYAPVANKYFLVQGFTDKGVTIGGSVDVKDYVVVLSKHIDVAKDAKITTADGGKIFLSAGAQRYSFRPDGKSTVYGGYKWFNNSSVNINGQLIAPGGTVRAGSAAANLVSATLNLDGVIDTSRVTGNAGTVFVASTGDVNLKGVIDSSAVAGTSTNAGSVTAQAGRNLTVDADIDASAAAGKGTVTLKAVRGTADVDGTVDAAASKTSAMTITAAKNNTVDAGVQVGEGKATISSTTGTTTINGYVDAQGKQPGSLPTTTSNNGGTIAIAGKTGVVTNGYVDAGAPQGKAGNVTISSSAGDVTTNTKVAGNVVTITAAKDVNLNSTNNTPADYITAYNGGYTTTNNVLTPTDATAANPGTGGTIKITSGGNTNINTTLSSGNTNSGGSIAATAKGNVVVNAPVITYSEKGTAGNVTLKGKAVTNASNAIFNLDGGAADGKLIVNGKVITANSI